MTPSRTDPRYGEARCGTERSRTWRPVDLRTSPAGITAAPHDLRHTLGTMLREQGNDLSVIAEVLGHASIEVTARYTVASEAETTTVLGNLTGPP